MGKIKIIKQVRRRALCSVAAILSLYNLQKKMLHKDKVKAALLALNGLTQYKNTYAEKFEEGGWEVVRIYDVFVLHEVPQYGGQPQFVGMYQLSDIDALVEQTQKLT